LIHGNYLIDLKQLDKSFDPSSTDPVSGRPLSIQELHFLRACALTGVRFCALFIRSRPGGGIDGNHRRQGRAREPEELVADMTANAGAAAAAVVSGSSKRRLYFCDAPQALFGLF
jgi:hypothetical protein